MPNPYQRFDSPLMWAVYEQKQGAKGGATVNPYSPTNQPWKYSRWNSDHGISVGKVKRRKNRRWHGGHHHHCHCRCHCC